MVASDLSGFCSIESGRAALLRGIPTRTGFSLVHLLQPFDNVRQNGSFSLLKFIVMNQFCGWNERKARVLMLGFLDNDAIYTRKSTEYNLELAFNSTPNARLVRHI
jgi:hypothetical protein